LLWWEPIQLAKNELRWELRKRCGQRFMRLREREEFVRVWRIRNWWVWLLTTPRRDKYTSRVLERFVRRSLLRSNNVWLYKLCSRISTTINLILSVSSALDPPDGHIRHLPRDLQNLQLSILSSITGKRHLHINNWRHNEAARVRPSASVLHTVSTAYRPQANETHCRASVIWHASVVH
jgi:hypothetical protein